MKLNISTLFYEIHVIFTGARLIILHADSENGWVPNCALVFKSGKSTGK